MRSRSESSSVAEELGGVADRELADLVDVLVADRDRERLRAQACAVARGARHLAHVALDLLARAVALGTRRAVARATGSRPRTAWCTSAGGHIDCGTTRAPASCPMPYSTAFFVVFLSFFHGVVDGEAVLVGERRRARARSSGCGTRPTERSRRRAARGRRSATTSSGSTSKRVPRPSQRSHAPYGELNEKLRGASSSNERPQCVHARCSENVSVSLSLVVTAVVAGTISTSATPSARRSAVSSESVRRRSMPVRRTSRSTTTSMVWFS